MMWSPSVTPLREQQRALSASLLRLLHEHKPSATTAPKPKASRGAKVPEAVVATMSSQLAAVLALSNTITRLSSESSAPSTSAAVTSSSQVKSSQVTSSSQGDEDVLPEATIAAVETLRSFSDAAEHDAVLSAVLHDVDAPGWLASVCPSPIQCRPVVPSSNGRAVSSETKRPRDDDDATCDENASRAPLSPAVARHVFAAAADIASCNCQELKGRLLDTGLVRLAAVSLPAFLSTFAKSERNQDAPLTKDDKHHVDDRSYKTDKRRSNCRCHDSDAVITAAVVQTARFLGNVSFGSGAESAAQRAKALVLQLWSSDTDPSCATTDACLGDATATVSRIVQGLEAAALRQRWTAVRWISHMVLNVVYGAAPNDAQRLFLRHGALRSVVTALGACCDPLTPIANAKSSSDPHERSPKASAEVETTPCNDSTVLSASCIGDAPPVLCVVALCECWVNLTFRLDHAAHGILPSSGATEGSPPAKAASESGRVEGRECLTLHSIRSVAAATKAWLDAHGCNDRRPVKLWLKFVAAPLDLDVLQS